MYTPKHRTLRPSAIRSSVLPLILSEGLEPRRLFASIVSGQTIKGTISVPGETDQYTFYGSAGDTFDVSLGDVTPASTGLSFGPALQVIDPNGKSVFYNDSNAGTSTHNQKTVLASAVGTYTILVRDYRSDAAGGNYALELTKVPGGLAADSNNDGGAIASGQTRTGTINRVGDVDAFTFSASAGDTFDVSLGDVTPASTGLSFGPALQVIDPNGKSVFYNDSNAGTSTHNQKTVLASAVGTYTILVRDYRSDAAGGNYALELTKVPGGLAADSNNDGGAIASGQTRTGTINRVGDVDAFTFSASAGDTFDVSLGDVTPASTGLSFGPALQVIDPNGKSVFYNDSNAGTSTHNQKTVLASAVGTYTILVRDYRSDAAGGNYALELTKVPGGLAADSNNDGGAIASGQTRTGTINRVGDVDAFTFSASAGDTFDVSLGDVTPASTGLSFGPALQVIDPDGKSVFYNDSNAGTSTHNGATVAASGVGTYTILVRDYRSDASGGKYSLKLTGNLHPVVTKLQVFAPSTQTATANVSKSFPLGSFTASNAKSPYSVDVDWGDGSAHAKFSVAVAGSIPAQSHAYTSSGSKTASILVTDANGATSNKATFGVTVSGTATGASIAGVVFKDDNKNGKRDNGEAGFGGQKVFLDYDSDKVIDSVDLVTYTAPDGTYKFTNVSATGSSANTRVRVVVPAGDTQTLPSGGYGQSVDLSTGHANTAIDFGIFVPPVSTSTLAGQVFNDADADGKFDAGELGLGLWQVYIDADNDGKFDTGEKTATTDADGVWSISGLDAGTYKLRVVQRAKTATTTPTSGVLTVTLAAGQSVTNNLFGEKRIA